MKRLLMRAIERVWAWLFATLLLSACAHGRQHTAHAPQALAGESLYRTGVELADAGDLTRGEQYLSAALRAGYAPEQTLRALLGTCVRAGRLRSAISYAAPWIADHPRAAGLRLLVASLHFALQEDAQAELHVRALLHHREPTAEAHYLLALLLQRQGHDLPQASAHFRRYLELSPSGAHGDEARAFLAPPRVQHVSRRQRS